jgi:hypothetical protein
MREKWLDASFDQLSRTTFINLSRRVSVMWKNIARNTSIHIVYRVSGFLSYRLNWVPTPLPASECYSSESSPYGSKGGDTLACGEGGGGPNSDEETETLVLYVYHNPTTL